MLETGSGNVWGPEGVRSTWYAMWSGLAVTASDCGFGSPIRIYRHAIAEVAANQG